MKTVVTNDTLTDEFASNSGSFENNTGQTNKYITFKMADYLFALPSEDILKIVATPSPSQGGMVSMGLVQLEQYSIQTLNLPKLLGLQQASAQAELDELTEAGSAQNPPFLMVMQNADKDLWGIAVDEPPDLMDVPKYALKPVPPEKRLTRTLRWVSHVVTYDLGGDRHTLLILDIAVLLAPKQAEIASSAASFPGIEPPLEINNNGNARKEEMYA
ncbi:MAG: chemotaxis protein CheW [Cyanobacteria bacterium P01_F01_bin.53]